MRNMLVLREERSNTKVLVYMLWLRNGSYAHLKASTTCNYNVTRTVPGISYRYTGFSIPNSTARDLLTTAGQNGAMDSTPDCCTVCGAVARFESLAKHLVS